MAQAERLREGYCYSVPSGMAVSTRSFWPVHPFIVVIEVRTIQDTRCCVRNKCLLQLTGVSYFCAENRIRQFIFAACGREGSSIVVVIERGQHTRHSRRWGLAQTEGLSDGYRPSFIVVIEMCALNPAHSSLLWSNCVLQRAAASFV